MNDRGGRDGLVYTTVGRLGVPEPPDRKGDHLQVVIHRVAQHPNKIPASFFALRSAQALLSPPGPASDLLRQAGSARLAWWALDEVRRGVNPFRRVLSAAALTRLVLS